MTAEWPLIAFTVLSQLAAGLAVFLALPGRPASRTGWLSVFVVGAAGLLASLFHLGQPLRAASALNGLGTSWLSAEGLLFGVFTALQASRGCAAEPASPPWGPRSSAYWALRRKA